MKKTLLLTLIIAITFPIITSAKINVAIIPFENTTEGFENAAALAESFTEDILVGLGPVNVVERGQIDQILMEQELTLQGLVEPETAVEIGQLAGAQYMILGKIVETSVSMELKETAEKDESGQYTGYYYIWDEVTTQVSISIKVLDVSTGLITYSRSYTTERGEEYNKRRVNKDKRDNIKRNYHGRSLIGNIILSTIFNSMDNEQRNQQPSRMHF